MPRRTGKYVQINGEKLKKKIETYKVTNNLHTYDLTNRLGCDRNSLNEGCNRGRMNEDFLKKLCKEIGETPSAFRINKNEETLKSSTKPVQSDFSDLIARIDQTNDLLKGMVERFDRMIEIWSK